VVTTARAWPVEAQGHRVEPGVIVDEVLGVGVLESAREVRVAFEASGRVTALAVDEGAMVALGDVLGTLDASDASRDLAVAEAVAGAAGAAVGRARAELERARVGASRAATERARADTLLAAGAIHRADHEAASERDASAQAEVRAMKSALRQAESNRTASDPHAAGSVSRRSPTAGSRARSRVWSWPATWRRGSW
jgi:multidrug efflux pump subunit AcrA (membrane-fusion protein)